MPDRKMGNHHHYRKTYPACCRKISEKKLQQLVARSQSPELFADAIREAAAELQLPEYLGELARLEFVLSNIREDTRPVPQYAAELTINPSLQIFENSWRNLTDQIAGRTGREPVKGREIIIIWKHPANGAIQARPATDEDLLVLKLTLEGLTTREVAKQGGIHLSAVEVAVVRSLEEGIIIGPESGIKRTTGLMSCRDTDPAYFTARIFTLQWHITQACDLHCRHCYDRSTYNSLSPQQEAAILDDFAEFCALHKVHGQVTFTGGNPLLHRNFLNLYREAADLGLSTAILGNPAGREQIERINAIQPLTFYQVSLEGLEEHNDYIRGEGHFQKVLTFLVLLRELGVYSMVMLTLTKNNLEQVLSLAELLKSKTDLFTFNRLSLTGEGAKLVAVDPEQYPAFLGSYAQAADSNECLGLKDNLLNIIYDQQGRELFGGCTGYGCGAAFNFVAVLADGTVHACRKFPSPLGNLTEQSLSEIYHSPLAEKYRNGAAECRECSLNIVCRGCLAVTHSHGLDIFRQKDPYCFIKR